MKNEKQALIEELKSETTATSVETGRKILSARLLAAIEKVRREAFVPPSETDFAYVNNALPIGYGQTISQPFIVAIMTELLEIGPEDTVLEIGTGSGYQAAILAELARKVYSVEVIPELVDAARKALVAEGYRNIELRCGDGALGWPEHAPFDAIIVTAAAEKIPPALIDQLKPGGRMIIPVGAPYAAQFLVLIRKDATGKTEQREVLAVAFVPLVSETSRAQATKRAS